MRYSIEPRDGIYVKGHGFLSFAKNMSNKCSQILFDSTTHATKVAKKSAADAIKSASKRAIQKIAEATGDLIGNKTDDSKVTKASKELHSKTSQNNLDEVKNETEISKERYISPEE